MILYIYLYIYIYTYTYLYLFVYIYHIQLIISSFGCWDSMAIGGALEMRGSASPGLRARMAQGLRHMGTFRVIHSVYNEKYTCIICRCRCRCIIYIYSYIYIYIHIYIHILMNGMMNGMIHGGSQRIG